MIILIHYNTLLYIYDNKYIIKVNLFCKLFVCTKIFYINLIYNVLHKFNFNITEI